MLLLCILKWALEYMWAGFFLPFLLCRKILDIFIFMQYTLDSKEMRGE
jgi:hypothetical protein